ncbi:MAG: hypothetical protein ABWK53_09150, partial [Anaerolineales bacterium]
PTPSTATLVLVNNSGVDIWYVYISPTTETTWGDDWLGSDIIPAGSTYTFSNITPGNYDLLAVDSNQNPVASQMGVSLTGQYTWTVTAQGGGGGGIGGGDATLTIINNSGVTIFYAYVSPSSSPNWGEDVLGAYTIENGGSFVVSGIVPGVYDLKVEDSNHNIIETAMGVTISGNVEWTVTGQGGSGPAGGGQSGGQAGTVTLNIVNNSGRDIFQLYLVPQNSANWGPDQLGGDTIPNGTSYQITDIPAGYYDFRAVDPNGQNIVIVEAINLNTDFTLTINP